jgi:hypothetical protein
MNCARHLSRPADDQAREERTSYKNQHHGPYDDDVAPTQNQIKLT